MIPGFFAEKAFNKTNSHYYMSNDPSTMVIGGVVPQAYAYEEFERGSCPIFTCGVLAVTCAAACLSGSIPACVACLGGAYSKCKGCFGL